MSDNGKLEAASSAIELRITWDQLTGAINVQGPINNSVICYGIMESAKDVIRKYQEANQSRIVQPNMIVPRA